MGGSTQPKYVIFLCHLLRAGVSPQLSEAALRHTVWVLRSLMRTPAGRLDLGFDMFFPLLFSREVWLHSEESRDFLVRQRQRRRLRFIPPRRERETGRERNRLPLHRRAARRRDVSLSFRPNQNVGVKKPLNLRTVLARFLADKRLRHRIRIILLYFRVNGRGRGRGRFPFHEPPSVAHFPLPHEKWWSEFWLEIPIR